MKKLIVGISYRRNFLRKTLRGILNQILMYSIAKNVKLSLKNNLTRRLYILQFTQLHGHIVTINFKKEKIVFMISVILP